MGGRSHVPVLTLGFTSVAGGEKGRRRLQSLSPFAEQQVRGVSLVQKASPSFAGPQAPRWARAKRKSWRGGHGRMGGSWG